MFLISGSALVASNHLMSSEGLLTFIGAKGISVSPLAALFFQKLHPSVSIVLGASAVFGWKTFLYFNVFVAAAAIPLVGAACRRWFGDSGWVASVMLALSPLYFLSAVTGQSNTTAIALFALSLWLADGTERRSVLAGLVAGFALWGRYEQALYIGAWSVVQVAYLKNVRFGIGAVVFPVIYWISGSVYHADLLWILHYPPVLFLEIGPSTIPEVHSTLSLLEMQAVTLAQTSPLMLIGLCLKTRGGVPRHVWWGAAFVGGAITLQALPPLLGGFFNYDFSPRYFLNHLVPTAILAAAAWGHVSERKSVGVWVSLLIGCLLFVLANPTDRLLYAAPFFLLPYALTAAGPRGRRAWIGLASALALLFTFAGPLRSYLAVQDQDAMPPPVEVPEGSEVFTNSHRASHAFRAAGRWDEVTVLLGYDVNLELSALLHQNHPQAEDIYELAEQELFGNVLWPCELPHTLAAGTFLLDDLDDRVESVYDLAALRENAEVILDGEGMRIVRLTETFTLTAPPLPEWYPAEFYCTPCPDECPIE